MSDKPYTKREMDTFFFDNDKRLDHQDDVLEKILTQVMKTNGRVTTLEAFKVAVLWAIGVIIAFFIFFIPYTISVIKKDLRETQEEITQAAIDNIMVELEKKYDIYIND